MLWPIKQDIRISYPQKKGPHWLFLPNYTLIHNKKTKKLWINPETSGAAPYKIQHKRRGNNPTAAAENYHG
jgi:hypothetical protein